MDFIDLRQFDRIGYDTETTGLHYGLDQAFGFSIATPDGQSAYFDIRKEPNRAGWINDQMRHYKGEIVCHGAAFDAIMSHRAGIILPLEQLEDTVITEVLLNETRFSYQLDDLAKLHLKEGKIREIYADLALVFGGAATRKVQMRNLPRADPEIVGPYARRDAELTLRLREIQLRELERQNSIKPDLCAVIDLEKRLMPVLIRNQMRGIRVDEEAAERTIAPLTEIIDRDQAMLNQMAGWDVNVNSSPQMKKLFAPHKMDGVWVARDGTFLESTPKGAPSIGGEVLHEMTDPAAKLIINIRSNLRTRDTFIKSHILGHAVNGVVYPHINQSKSEHGGTKHGRLSYVDPAMQQIPSRNKQVAAIVKPIFLPDEGQKWVDADLASFEVRVFADLIAEPALLEAYKANPDLDMHQWVSDLTGIRRNATYSGEPNAKQLNLSMIFNSGDGSIAAKMGMPWKWTSFTNREGQVITYRKPGLEAAAVIDQYHRRLPGVKDLAMGSKLQAERRGFVTTRMGRRIRFPNKRYAYKASGLRIQGTAADLNKENWLLIDECLQGTGGRILLNTHDSYSMSLPEHMVDKAYEEVKRQIEKPGRLSVPLILELSGVGDSWWGALTNGD